MNSSRWMKLVVMVLSLLVVPSLALAQAGDAAGTGGNGNGNGNGRGVNGRTGSATFLANNPMPVLIYTVWGLNGGASVTASSDVSTLVVYDNGMATWSQSNADGTNTSACKGNCLDTVQLSAAQVNQLVQQLRRAGAFRQNSNNVSASSSDTTITTITVFSHVQGSTSVAQTFSFNNTVGSQGRLPAIQNVFSSFFSTSFGSSSINGSGGSGNGG